MMSQLERVNDTSFGFEKPKLCSPSKPRSDISRRFGERAKRPARCLEMAVIVTRAVEPRLRMPFVVVDASGVEGAPGE